MDPSAASFVKLLLHERKRQAEPSPLASAREKQGEEAERFDCGAVQLGDCGPPATPAYIAATPIRSGSFAHRPVPPPRLAPPSPPARWLTRTRPVCLAAFSRPCVSSPAPPPTGNHAATPAPNAPPNPTQP